MAASLIDANFWRQRANEAHHLADQESDPISKKMLLQIAEEYECLAIRADLRAKGIAPD